MNVYICTDMEGLAGVDHWDQCYHPDDNAPAYRYGLEQLAADTNAAVAGCFDAGAATVCVIDGHGRNRNRGFEGSTLHPRAKQVGKLPGHPTRWEGLDESIDALAIIGQHAMAGTINGFIDHTSDPKTLCRYMINGEEHGEMGQMTLYAGFYGIPLVYVSGDEACCDETHRLYPHAATTPTKRGTGWDTCELYAVDEVRANLRRDIAKALASIDPANAWRLEPPIEITVEWAWSGKADQLARGKNVERLNARTTRWHIQDPRDIHTWPV